MELIGAMRQKSIKAMLKELFVQPKGEVLTSAQLQRALGESRTEWARRARVLERNGYTCQACGAGIEDRTQTGRPVKLVIDHHEAFSYGGPDDDAKPVLCQECNSGAKNLVFMPPTWKWLMSQVRRAKREDQLKVLEQLEKKFR